MGTNYYLHERPPCECCRRPFKRLHIGKSSGGWCFSLHVDPDNGIHDLPDWIERWSRPGAVIRDEYGEALSGNEMEAIITSRGIGRTKDWDSKWWRDSDWYYSESQFHQSNGSERGPNGLLRHRIDGRHCSGHGAGTWDLMPGEFR
jgi:hypothetical protein